MIVYQPGCEPHRRLPDQNEGEEYDYNKFLNQRSAEGIKIKTTRKLPGYNLLILNPDSDQKNLYNSKIIVWLKNYHIGTGYDHLFIITPKRGIKNNESNSWYGEFKAFFDSKWKDGSCRPYQKLKTKDNLRI